MIGSVLAVKHIIHIFPEIGKGPKLNASIHQGALTEGLLTFFTVLISVGLSRNIPGSFFMKTWISSIAKLTLHVHVLGVGITGGCMNPAAVLKIVFVIFKQSIYLFVYLLCVVYL